jgi:hypothetical protein
MVTGDRAYLQTRSRIEHGQELFVPYGTGYWNYHNSKTDPKPSKQINRAEVETALRDKTLQQVKELQKIIKNHPTFLVDKTAKDYNEKWRASKIFTATALDNAKVLPALDSNGFFHSKLPDEQASIFNAVADMVTETAFENNSFMDWGECGWMSGRMMKAIFNNTDGEKPAWKAHPLTDDWFNLSADQQQDLSKKIISGEFHIYNDLVRDQMPFQASVELDNELFGCAEHWWQCDAAHRYSGAAAAAQPAGSRNGSWQLHRPGQPEEGKLDWFLQRGQEKAHQGRRRMAFFMARAWDHHHFLGQLQSQNGSWRYQSRG